MSYDSTKMRRREGPPGEAGYRYTTTDLLSVAVASGYFDDAVDDFNLADEDDITIVASNGGGLYKVVMSGSTVTLEAMPAT